MFRRVFHTIRVAAAGLGLAGGSMFATLVLPDCDRDLIIIEPDLLTIDENYFIPDNYDAPDPEATPMPLP